MDPLKRDTKPPSPVVTRQRTLRTKLLEQQWKEEYERVERQLNERCAQILKDMAKAFGVAHQDGRMHLEAEREHQEAWLTSAIECIPEEERTRMTRAMFLLMQEYLPDPVTRRVHRDDITLSELMVNHLVGSDLY